MVQKPIRGPDSLSSASSPFTSLILFQISVTAPHCHMSKARAMYHFLWMTSERENLRDRVMSKKFGVEKLGIQKLVYEKIIHLEFYLS